MSVAMCALAQIEAIGARLDGLRLSRTADGILNHCLNLTGLSARQARALADRLAKIDGIEDVRVEHHVVRV